MQAAAVADRPVILDVPHQLLRLEVEATATRAPEPHRTAIGPDEDALDHALGVIAASQRPLVVAGRGAVISGARSALLALSEVIAAPVATTLLGRDLFRGEPFDLGLFGSLSHEIALDVIRSSDCVVAFGASLNPYTTAAGSLTAGLAVVHVDVDPTRLGYHDPVTAAVIGDARVVAELMQEKLAAAGILVGRGRSEQLARRLASRDPWADFRDAGTADTVDLRSAIIRLDELLPENRIVVTDVGRFVAAPWRYLHVQRPSDFTHTASFGSVGLALQTAVGASIADRSRLTVAVVGDGAAMMSLLEFATAVRYELPLLVVVANDGCYGSEWAQLERYGADPRLSLMRWPSFAEVACALGGRGLVVRSVPELDAVVRLIADGAMPLLVDLRIDPEVEIGSIR